MNNKIYPITNFPNQKINDFVFKNSITSSDISLELISIEKILGNQNTDKIIFEVNEDSYKFTFNSELTDNDITILDGIVSNHNGNEFFITGLHDNTSYFDPDKSYDVLGMKKKPTINDDGFLSVMEYYKDYDPETSTYIDLVVKEDNTWVTNPDTSLVESRTTVFSFYLTDGSIGYQKTTVKYFDLVNNFLSVREEADRRRKNLIYKSELYIMSNLLYANALALLATLTTERQKYIVGIKQDLLDLITNESTYLTAPQKVIILAILDR